MKITREIDYALRIMDFLAKKNNPLTSKGINAPAISDKTNVQVKFALKILRKLKIAGLVDSFKGSCGGYSLAKKPSEIKLLDIIEAIDGPVLINNCLDESSECSRFDLNKKNCFYYHIFDDINEMIAEKLSKITLESAVNHLI